MSKLAAKRARWSEKRETAQWLRRRVERAARGRLDRVVVHQLRHACELWLKARPVPEA